MANGAATESDGYDAGSVRVVAFKVHPDGGPASQDVIELLRGASTSLGTAPTSLGEVDRWSDSLTHTLRQRGYPVGQVLMTQVDWQAAQQGGVPVFTAYPGRISGIRIDNKTRVNDDRLARLVTRAMCDAEPLEGNCLLRTGRLERSTQLLQDIPGVAIAKAPEFAPGAGVGDIDVQFDLAQRGKPFTGDVFFDNKGIDSTGLYRLGVMASGNNFLGLGENYALTVTGTEKRMWTGSLTGGVPIFDDGLRLTGGFTRQQYTINAVTRLVGVANTVQVGLLYPVTRGLDANVWVGGSYLHSRTKTEYSDFGFAAHSTLDALRFSLQANNGDRAQQLRSNIWSGEVALTAGHQSNDSAAYNAATRVAGNYAKLTGTGFGTYGLNRGGDLFLMGQFNGQYASKNLDPSEKLGVGGPNAVRAYRADEGSFDDGAILNAGLYKRVPIAIGHQLQFGVFSDVAIGRVNHNPWENWSSGYVGVPDVSNRRILAGYGVAVDWLTPIGATLSLSISKAYGFASSSWVDPGNKPVQYWLAVTWGR
ncbi:hemolysin activation/secretion protein [Cupriavidus agavae]|uniref:Hemolysin activation/secretion protein n=2 Tax=Cupriavidus agavae TaxID=1001822 RepID=A0A4Q7R7M5_9BURK|nr:hemolysin activation/secretion protein [Cupriavidus agavae]